jgi:hypothetical protein
LPQGERGDGPGGNSALKSVALDCDHEARNDMLPRARSFLIEALCFDHGT